MRKGHPATGWPSLQGRIVPTEARPSKLSAQIVGSRYRRVKQFLGLKSLYFQLVTQDSQYLRKLTENNRFRLYDKTSTYFSIICLKLGRRAGVAGGSRHSRGGLTPCRGNS